MIEINPQVAVEFKIDFSPPYIDEDVIAEVTDALRSGWITTGPKVKELEALCEQIIGTEKADCVNSWTSGALLTLKWLGIKPGDEIVIPAYTYAATALAVLNAGAKPVMVDVLPDFSIDPQKIKEAITEHTKAVITVDFAGWPCDYDRIAAVLELPEVRNKFTPANTVQATFGRPVLISDAAHALGAQYNGKAAALAADITIFSLHAVKNVTTAEGGVICLHLPKPFDNTAVHKWMKLNSLNGQTKDAYTKLQKNSWRYDIVEQGLKINMPDVCAAIGLAQLRKYDDKLLPSRKVAYHKYKELLSGKPWAILPITEDNKRVSSYHLFPLRIEGINELQRDAIILKLAEAGVASNVHFVPLPMMTLFKEMGYKMDDYPVSFQNYVHEISLPVYPQLTGEECRYVIEQLEKAYNAVV